METVLFTPSPSFSQIAEHLRKSKIYLYNFQLQTSYTIFVEFQF